MIRMKKKVLLVERLGLLNLFFSIIVRKNYEEIYFVFYNRLISGIIIPILRIMNWDLAFVGKKIEYSDLPGSYFDSLEESNNIINEQVLAKNTTNPYFSIPMQFCKEPLTRLVISNELNARYTQDRVKTYTILRYLSRGNRNITLIPQDNENIHGLLSNDSSAEIGFSVPWFFSFLNAFFSIAKNTLIFCMFPFFLIGTGCILLSRGISFSSNKKESFEFGLDVRDSGIEWDQAYREMFLYDSSRFHPSKILHVSRGILKDDRTRTFFKTHKYPFVDFNRVKIPAGYLVKRILVDFICLNTLRWITQLFNLNKNSNLVSSAIAAMKMTMEAEILYEHYTIRVFISSDDFNPFHIVRTIVANRNNCFTAGFCIGDYAIKELPYIVYDRYCIWGDFYRTFHERVLKYTNTEVIGAGIFGLDKTYEFLERGHTPGAYRNLARQFRIVMITGTSHSPEIFMTKQFQLEFYKTVLDEVCRYPDTFCIIKPKSAHELDDPEFTELFSNYDRIKIEKKIWTFRLLTICDLVICPGCTSIGLESLLAGKKVLYYDNTGWNRHIYAQYSPYIVAFNALEFRRNIDRILVKSEYLDNDTLDRIRTHHGFSFDGHVTDRLKSVCIELAQRR